MKGRYLESKMLVGGVRKSILLIGLFLYNGIVYAQEGLPFYEHYLISDNYLLNPSYAGVNPTVLKVTATHHSQWQGVEGAPSTQTLSAHARLYDRLSGGVYAFYDRNGASSLTGVNISMAYHIPIGAGDSYYNLSKDNSFSFGLSYHGLNQSFDVAKWKPETWNDPLLKNTSVFNHYFNVGSSFYYNGFFVGLSVVDIPLVDNTAIVNAIEPLPTWYYLNGGYEFFIADNIQLTPSFMFSLNGQTDRQMDLTLRSKVLSGNNSFGFGLNYRNAKDESGYSSSSISPLVDLKINRLRIGYAYHIGISDVDKELGTGHLFSLGFDFVNTFESGY